MCTGTRAVKIKFSNGEEIKVYDNPPSNGENGHALIIRDMGDGNMQKTRLNEEMGENWIAEGITAAYSLPKSSLFTRSTIALTDKSYPIV